MNGLDVGTLCRIQFGLTAAFHFLFPPITIGLSSLLCIVEWRAWRHNDPVAESAGRFFAKILALTFAVGVATGVPMEFQFGTNWSRYSKFVGDICYTGKMGNSFTYNRTEFPPTPCPL